MRRQWAAWAVVALCFVGASVEAATITQWRRNNTVGTVNFTSGWQNTQNAACVALAAHHNSVSHYGYTEYVLAHTGAAGGGHCAGTRKSSGTPGSYSDFGSGSWNSQVVEWEDPCEESAGHVTQLTGTGSMPATGCFNSCEYESTGVGVTMGGTWVTSAQGTGVTGSCGFAGDPPSETANCVSSSAGQFCAAKSNKNCGTINGQSVCLDAIPEGSCEFLGDGGMICAADTPSPPAPDDGDASPATPDGSMTHTDDEGVERGFDYYGPDTVAGSGGGTSGASPGTSAGGGGGGSGDGEGGADGVDPAGIEGYGEAPDGFAECAADLGACATGIVSGAWASLTANIPLLGLVDGLADSFDDAGECPTAPITLFEETYDLMEPVCEVSDGVDALMALLFQVAWSLFALRIILKAQ